VSPEAARGGPIALVEDDDLISIDIPKRVLSMVGQGKKRMKKDEVQSLLDQRKKAWKAPLLGHPQGVLERYSKQAAQFGALKIKEKGPWGSLFREPQHKFYLLVERPQGRD
jgi:dihydroxyacid dehydratase/phosphogluconate dehydratase